MPVSLCTFLFLFRPRALLACLVCLVPVMRVCVVGPCTFMRECVPCYSFAILIADHQLVAYVQLKNKAYQLQAFGAACCGVDVAVAVAVAVADLKPALGARGLRALAHTTVFVVGVHMYVIFFCHRLHPDHQLCTNSTIAEGCGLLDACLPAQNERVGFSPCVRCCFFPLIGVCCWAVRWLVDTCS